MATEAIIDGALNKTLKYWGSLSEEPIINIEGASLLISGIPHPSFNYFFGFKTLGKRTIQEGAKALAKRQAPCALIVLSYLLNEENKQELEAAGFRFLDRIVGVCLSLDAWKVFETPENIPLGIKRVSNDATFNVWDDLAAKMFDHRRHSMKSFLKKYIKQGYLKEGPLQLFLAYYKGVPVGTSLVYLEDGVANFMWDGVLPQYRKHGINTAMVARRLQVAREAGCHSAVAQCFRSSINIYLRAGFKPGCEYTWYVLPCSPGF